MYSVLGFSKDTLHWKKYLWAAVLFVFVLTYSYHPEGNSDLTRYVEWIKMAKSSSYFGYVEFMDDGLYVTNFLFWLAGHLEMPYLVPAFTTAVVYAITLYITCDFAERNQLQKWIPYVLILQVLMLPYVTIINNVRNIFAFAIVILAVYRDVYLNKRNVTTLLLYIVPIFVHKTSFVLILLRLLSILAGRYLVLSLVIALLIPTFLNFLLPYIPQISSLGTVGKIIGDALLTAYRSMTSTSDWAMTVMTGKYYLANRYFSYLMSGILFVITSISLTKLKRKESNPIRKYLYFLSLIYIITIATYVFRTPVYWRFFAIVIVASGPILILLLKDMRLKKVSTKQIWYVFLVAGLFFVALQFYGTIQNVDYKDWTTSVILNPLFNIIREFVWAIFRF